jgi:hypothetical protein
VLKGVSTRQYHKGDEPTKGVEVGVFIVKKTRAATKVKFVEEA